MKRHTIELIGVGGVRSSVYGREGEAAFASCVRITVSSLLYHTGLLTSLKAVAKSPHVARVLWCFAMIA
jgi:hypothetical protein